MYHIELGASNTHKFTTDTISKAYNKLRKLSNNSRCSVVDLEDNTEIYYGTVEDVLELMVLDLEMGEIE